MELLTDHIDIFKYCRGEKRLRDEDDQSQIESLIPEVGALGNDVYDYGDLTEPLELVQEVKAILTKDAHLRL
jgi:hypothetical protein